MDQTTGKISELLSKSKNIGIVTPKDPNLDQMGAALSLFLSLTADGRNVTIATPNDPLVEVSTLVGVDKVKNSVGGAVGDLVVSFPYREEEIEKVSYTLENDTLNIVVKAGENGLSFNEKDVKYVRPTAGPDLLFVIGAARVSDLGKLFDPIELKDTTVVNIDNSPENQGFGDVVMVSTRLSSVSEQIANLILNLGLKMDLDIAQNLMAGIAKATGNFQDPRTSALAFEMAGILMRQGAMRPSDKKVEGTIPDFRPSSSPSSDIPQRPIKMASEANKPSSTEAPDDWLAPKIYKGSTSFES